MIDIESFTQAVDKYRAILLHRSINSEELAIGLAIVEMLERKAGAIEPVATELGDTRQINLSTFGKVEAQLENLRTRIERLDKDIDWTREKDKKEFPTIGNRVADISTDVVRLINQMAGVESKLDASEKWYKTQISLLVNDIQILTHEINALKGSLQIGDKPVAIKSIGQYISNLRDDVDALMKDG